MTILICTLLATLAWEVPLPALAEELFSPISVTLGDLPVSFDQPPIIRNDRVLVPVRAVVEQMGGTVSYDASASLISVSLNGHSIHLTVGEPIAYLDGKAYRLDVAPQIIGDRTLIPIRFVAETAGYTVGWDDASKRVSIHLAETALYSLTDEGDAQVFQNHLDGYRITLPAGFHLDRSMPQIMSRFTWDATTLEIYRQDNDTLYDSFTYIQYSNRAIRSQPTRFHITADHMTQIGNLPCTVLEWYRAPLSRVPNDQYCYYKADITDGFTTYTFLFKSIDPIGDIASGVLASFTPVSPTVSSDALKTEPIHGRARTHNAETAACYEQIFGNDASLTWGIFEPTYLKVPAVLQQSEAEAGYHFPILLTYTGILPYYNPASVGDFLNAAWREGRVVELTLQNPLNDDPSVCYDVLSGKYDGFLQDYANAVADFSHPVLLRLFNEMNGDWCQYSAYQMGLDTELARSLYRYVADFFARAGADNVLYVFNPNSVSFPDFKWNDPLLYYPGDGYADIWGLTAYNTGTYYSGETWQSFDELYQALYEKTQRITDMPLMITEFACARQGGDKEAWVSDMLDDIRKYPDIKVAVWWNHADFDGENTSRAYYMFDTEQLKEIWRSYFLNHHKRIKKAASIE